MAKDYSKGIVKKGDQPLERGFSYQLDGYNRPIDLNFKLRVDGPKEIKAFIALMDAAKADLEKELAGLKESK